MQVPASEIANRLATFQALLQQHQVDAAIVRQNTDLYYFTGTVQDAHLLVPASGEPCFLVRRDIHRAAEQSPIRPIVPMRSLKQLPETLFSCCGRDSLRRLGMELDVIPAATFFFHDEKLFPKQQIVDVGGLIRQVRMIKSDWEIEMMRKAGGISLAVAKAVPGLLQAGIQESELSIELERVARQAGHLGFARVRTFNLEILFGHILSGPEAAISSYCDSPTGGPGVSPAFGQGAGNRSIRTGDLVSVDIMMNHHGYLNDQTRNFAVGDPHPSLARTYAFCQQLHRWVRETARPGLVTGDLYDSIVKRVAEAGLAEGFMGHADTAVSFIGHGLGLEVDEFPFIARGQKTRLEENMTFALEPKWVYPELGVVGFENTYRVTTHGLESLNRAPEELIIV